MLILTRREGERLFIGEDIVVSVEHIGGGKVRLGVEAPKNVKVLREEIAGRREGERR